MRTAKSRNAFGTVYYKVVTRKRAKTQDSKKFIVVVGLLKILISKVINTVTVTQNCRPINLFLLIVQELG